ncbi:MAG: hypothetical protein ABFD75_12525 [Smithella sp.]
MTDPFAQAVADIFNSAVGADATFTPAGGVAIPCRVLLDRSVLMQPTSMQAQVWERGTTIEAQLAEIINEPDRGDTFAIGAEIFTVQSIEENDGITVKMIVT